MKPKDMPAYMSQRRAKRRKEAEEYLGGVCIICGTTNKLEFDHIDSSLKSYNISSAKALDGPWDRLVVELNKCQLLCYGHHREKTRQAGETGGGHNRILNPQHGTSVMYNAKCRCTKCKTWKKDYRAGLIDTQGNPIHSEVAQR